MNVDGRPISFDLHEILSVAGDIDGQIYARDFKLIDQSDMIVSYIPVGPERPADHQQRRRAGTAARLRGDQGSLRGLAERLASPRRSSPRPPRGSSPRSPRPCGTSSTPATWATCRWTCGKTPTARMPAVPDDNNSNDNDYNYRTAKTPRTPREQTDESRARSTCRPTGTRYDWRSH